MYEHLEAYHLRIVLEGDHACLYQLVPGDGTEAESVRLAFLGPECPTIIIYWDLCPGVNGAVSATGYGLGWFIAAGGDHYLLSKFLTKSLQWDAIAAYIDDRLKDGAEEGDTTTERCEGCPDKPAVTHDDHGIPLCGDCYDLLGSDSSEEEGQDGEAETGAEKDDAPATPQ